MPEICFSEDLQYMGRPLIVSESREANFHWEICIAFGSAFIGTFQMGKSLVVLVINETLLCTDTACYRMTIHRLTVTAIKS